MSFLTTLNAAALIGIIFSGAYSVLTLRDYNESSGDQGRQNGRKLLITLGVLVLCILVFVLTRL